MSPSQADQAAASLQAKFLNAAVENDSVTVQELLAQGVDIESRDANGRSALLLATHHNAIDVARILIDTGANVNAMDNITDSPYLYAGAEGRLEILRMALAHGADLSSVNRYGGTALIPAAHHGHIETVQELLKTEIDIDHINYLGWTALLEAIILGDGGPTYVEIIRLLIEAGADINIADGDNVTPLAHATTRNYTEIADMLRTASENKQD
ncbi:MAG: ankyrin repeat domain-containing protein [Gammaproteobacteria bacterium]